MLPVLNLQTNECESLQKIKLPYCSILEWGGGRGGSSHRMWESTPTSLASTLDQALLHISLNQTTLQGGVTPGSQIKKVSCRGVLGALLKPQRQEGWIRIRRRHLWLWSPRFLPLRHCHFPQVLSSEDLFLLLLRYWVGPKVCLVFSITSYGKTHMNILVNSFFIACHHKTTTNHFIITTTNTQKRV